MPVSSHFRRSGTNCLLQFYSYIHSYNFVLSEIVSDVHIKSTVPAGIFVAFAQSFAKVGSQPRLILPHGIININISRSGSNENARNQMLSGSITLLLFVDYRIVDIRLYAVD